MKSLDQNHLVLLGHSGVFGASTPDKCAAAMLTCLQCNRHFSERGIRVSIASRSFELQHDRLL